MYCYKYSKFVTPKDIHAMRKALLLLTVILLFGWQAGAQTSTFPVNGMHDDRPELYAYTGATIHIDATTVLANATLIAKKGKIVAVGTDVSIPKGAVVIDLSGKHIYPSFVDLYTQYGLEPLKKPAGPHYGPQMESDKKGPYGWNQAIKPEISAVEHFTQDSKQANQYRNAGFGAVLTHQQDGIARGTGAFVLLSGESDNDAVLIGRASNQLSFDPGISTQDYPGSLMGAIALIRQTYLDAQWYAGLTRPDEYNITLESWNQNQNLPQIFEVGNVLSLLRADRVGDEFNEQYIIKGSGDEYQRLDAVKNTGASLIVPVVFPEAYDVEDPFDALNVSLADMKNWELAPANAGFLEQYKIPFALTADGLEKTTDFWSQVLLAVKNGLSKEDAFKAVTIIPAQMIGADELVGSLYKGKLANFLVTDGDLFDESTKILENWVAGAEYIVNDPTTDLNGDYSLIVGDNTYRLKIKGNTGKAKGELTLTEADTMFSVVSISIKDDRLVTLSFVLPGADEATRLSGLIEGSLWKGKAELPDGNWVTWSLVPGEKEPKKEDKKEEEPFTPPTLDKIIYPFVAYGSNELPKQEIILIKNATVWTNTDQGILENTDVLIQGGKIAAIGKGLAVKNADRVIDGTGKHVTCGIIDEHSHIAISGGVNEWTQASSAEVRIGDVINSKDINIYRQLSGGVTTSQLLHGSANPIGGQSGIVKLRWGFTPEEMKFKAASPFIKFALGENVKQSNWGDFNTVRYPQTRMGVEQIYMDYFTRALEYGKTWEHYNSLSGKIKKNFPAPRRDLELEALYEILQKKRFITCHSYVQSEINMLMHVADHFHFTLNTFTHVLEGYKVADKLKAHGANASTFSDWWAYKYEVIDAIPYNAAIMSSVGVNVAINSDDAEMGRRLNQEAAKSVKYGGMSEEDAWKMVTLNPAKMLHIDDHVGSVAVGMDADVVVWSDNPLSIYARVEHTFVDGMLMFDLQKDQDLQQYIQQERKRLINLMLKAKRDGAPTQKPVKKEQHLWHCDD